MNLYFLAKRNQERSKFWEFFKKQQKYTDLYLAFNSGYVEYLLKHTITKPNMKLVYDSKDMLLVDRKYRYVTKPIPSGTYSIFQLEIVRLDNVSFDKICKEIGLLNGIKYVLTDNYGYIEGDNSLLNYYIRETRNLFRTPTNNSKTEFIRYLQVKYSGKSNEYIEEWVRSSISIDKLLSYPFFVEIVDLNFIESDVYYKINLKEI